MRRRLQDGHPNEVGFSGELGNADPDGDKAGASQAAVGGEACFDELRGDREDVVAEGFGDAGGDAALGPARGDKARAGDNEVAFNIHVLELGGELAGMKGVEIDRPRWSGALVARRPERAGGGGRNPGAVHTERGLDRGSAGSA